MMMRYAIMALMSALMLTSLASAASLEKAKVRSNGLRDEAKKELVDVLYDSTSPDDDKAYALLLLGEIALDEKNGDAARENWDKLVATYPSSPAAAAAKAKLEVLQQLSSAATQAADPPAPKYPPGTVLVIGPSDYEWAAPQIAGARGPSAVAITGSLSDAMKLASTNTAIIGILQLALDVEVVFETGTLTCYQPNGAKTWDKTVRVSSPGGAEHIAHVFVNKLAERTKSKACP